mgnify:CR=1 FL=1
MLKFTHILFHRIIFPVNEVILEILWGNRIDLRVPPFIDKEFIGVIANSIDWPLNILGKTLVAHIGVMDLVDSDAKCNILRWWRGRVEPIESKGSRLLRSASHPWLTMGSTLFACHPHKVKTTPWAAVEEDLRRTPERYQLLHFAPEFTPAEYQTCIR